MLKKSFEQEPKFPKTAILQENGTNCIRQAGAWISELTASLNWSKMQVLNDRQKNKNGPVNRKRFDSLRGTSLSQTKRRFANPCDINFYRQLGKHPSSDLSCTMGRKSQIFNIEPPLTK